MRGRTCIMVLSMHRSGTSALTGVLSLVGVNLGKDMMGAHECNVKGFFENNKITLFNDRLLGLLYSSWDDILGLPPGWQGREELLAMKQEAAEIIDSEFGSSDLIGMKDPRCCVLMPFWKDVMEELAIDTVFVTSIRNPLEVARSLKKRDSFSLEKSVLLWLEHMLHAELYSRGFPRAFVSFDDLLEDPMGAIDYIEKALGIDFPRRSGEIGGELKEFLDPGLKHHRLAIDEDSDILRLAFDLFDVLRGLPHKEATSEDDLARIDSIRNEFLAITKKLCFEELRSERTSRFLERQKAIAVRDGHNEGLEIAIKERDGRIGGLEQNIGGLEEALRERDGRIGGLEAALRERDSRVGDLEEALRERDGRIGGLEAALRERDSRVEDLEDALGEKEATLQQIYAGQGWKLLSKYFRLRDRYLSRNSMAGKLARSIWKRMRSISVSNPLGRQADNKYDEWIRRNEPRARELKQQRATGFAIEPKISIIVPTFNTPERFLVDMIESVVRQTYSNWELCIADGGSETARVAEILKRYSATEARIKVDFLGRNLGIAGNSNRALSLASGSFVALLDHDDVLAPFALFEVVRRINEQPTADFIYSDEDKITERGGRRFDAHFKPDWSPDTLLSYNYICHLAVIKKATVDSLGGFREGFEGAQYYDLFLRVAAVTGSISHIPKVLYHWRAHKHSTAQGGAAGEYALASSRKAIAEYLAEKGGHKANVTDGISYGTFRVSYDIEGSPEVSIVIPTRNNAAVLRTCVSSILEKTDYQNYRILVVDNSSDEAETLEYFERIKLNPKVSVIEYDRPFNYSAINNHAVSGVSSDYIVLLNNDTEVISRRWLDEMLQQAQRREVGAVGAKLYYPNNTVQHAGVILGVLGLAGHSHKYFPRESAGYFSRLNIIQNLSAVTAACMMMRREVFVEVGGLDEGYSHAFNDVDLCMKIREKGYLIVYTPYAELYHHESLSRGYDDTDEKRDRLKKEIRLFHRRWRKYIERGDPYYSPNLTLEREDFSIR